jgi:hypothetical protein
MSTYLSWRGAELEAGWQGITHLSMHAPPLGFAALVTVHLARNASGMSADRVQVTGGRRIAIEDPEIIVTNGTQTIHVRFRERGDHSPYTIQLLDGGGDPLHPFFAEAQFGFYIDCETGDCRPPTLQAPADAELPPAIDTRYKDFRGFMRVLSEWVRVANPDWTDLAPASQERMLMELVAHQGDMLSYYQDRVANEAFIATASERHSLRQHATLLGYPVFEGQAATTTLAFEVATAGFVPEGLAVENRRLHGERRVVFSVTARTRVDPANNASAIVVAAWPGATSASIPTGTAALLLFGQTYALLAGMRVAIVQGAMTHLATITRVRLLDLPGWVGNPNDPLAATDQPLTEITIDPPLGLDVRPWDAVVPLRIHVNLADARHGEQKVSWINPAASSPTGNLDLVLQLTHRTSTVVAVPRGTVMVPQLRAVLVPEGPVIHETDARKRSAPAIEVAVDGEPWTREEHLHASSSFDTHYTAGTDNQGRLWLQFGDGVRGREVEVVEVSPGVYQPTVSIRLTYRVGEPLDGNCARDTLTEPVAPIDPGFATLHQSITNVTGGAGGQRKDTLDEIRDAIPTSLTHGALQRAVSLNDYATIAKTVGGVSRAAAKAIGGPFNTVLILIDADDEATLTDALRQRVWLRIDEMRMAGREHFVEPAEYVPIRVGLVLCIEPGFLRHEVRDRVLASLRPGTDARPGYFHPDRLTFGQDLESGELMAFVQAIPGVRSVRLTAFCRLDAVVESVEDRIDLGATEVARLDADEDFPENGELTLEVVGLDLVDEAGFVIDTAAGAP